MVNEIYAVLSRTDASERVPGAGLVTAVAASSQASGVSVTGTAVAQVRQAVGWAAGRAVAGRISAPMTGSAQGTSLPTGGLGLERGKRPATGLQRQHVAVLNLANTDLSTAADKRFVDDIPGARSWSPPV